MSTEFQATVTRERFHINVIYLFACERCKNQFVGPLSQSFVNDLANINRTLNCMVKEGGREDLNNKS